MKYQNIIKKNIQISSNLFCKNIIEKIIILMQKKIIIKSYMTYHITKSFLYNQYDQHNSKFFSAYQQNKKDFAKSAKALLIFFYFSFKFLVKKNYNILFVYTIATNFQQKKIILAEI